MNNTPSFPYENKEEVLSLTDVERGQEFVAQSLIKNPLLFEYINFSHHQNDKKQQAITKQAKIRVRNLRIYVSILIVLIAVAISFAWNANISKKEAVVAKNDALKSQSSLLLKSVEGENRKYNFDTGVLLGLNALPGLYGGDRPWNADIPAFRKSVLFSHKVFHFNEKLAQQHVMDKKGTKVVQFHYHSNVVSIFSMENKRLITELKLDGRVIAANISEDGEFVSALDEHGNLAVYVAKSGKLFSKFVNKSTQNEKRNDGDLNLSFSADNTKLMISYRFTANGGGYSIYRVLDGILLNHVNKDKNTVLAWAKWHPNGINVISLLFKRISTSEAWVELDYLSPAGHITNEKLPGNVEIRNEYQVSPNGEFIAFSNNVWNLSTLKLVASNKENRPLLFLSDEKLIVKDDNKLKVISTTTGKEVKHWKHGTPTYLFNDIVNKQLLGFNKGSGIQVYDDKSDGYPNRHELFKNLSVLDIALNQKLKSIILLSREGIYSIPLYSKINSTYFLPKSSRALFYSNTVSEAFGKGSFLTINQCFVCNKNLLEKYFMWKWNTSNVNIDTQQLHETFGYVNKNATVMAVSDTEVGRIDLYAIELKGKVYTRVNNSRRGDLRELKYLTDEVDIKKKLSSIKTKTQHYQFNSDGSLIYFSYGGVLSIHNTNNGERVRHIIPTKKGYIEGFEVLENGDILISSSNYVGKKEITLWSDFDKPKFTFSLQKNQIKRKVNHYDIQWFLNSDQTKLVASLDGYRLDVYSLVTGKKTKSTPFNEAIIYLSISNDDVLVSLKSGNIYHWHTSQIEEPIRWLYQRNTLASFVTPKNVLLRSSINAGNRVVVPFNKKEELLKLAVKKLPINRKCLSDLERKSFGLPSLTYREKVRLTCEN
jgi:hypothetical protein